MLEIISHRGICDSDESSLTGIKNCIKYNFGVELDIRIKHNDVYISHDVSIDGVLLSDACNIMDESKIRKIFHIKEIEALDNTIDILIKNNIKNFFLFNTENNKFSSGKNVPTADYINRKPTHIDSMILWCDETYEKWFDKQIISDLKKQDRFIFAHSAELINECTMSEIKKEWDRINQLGFHGICTNFPKECSKYFGGKLN